MTSYFHTETCEYNLQQQTIYCCTYGNEHSCSAKADWKFCPYCGHGITATFTQSLKNQNIPLPPSPPPELENDNLTVDELEYMFTSEPPVITIKQYTPPQRFNQNEMWPYMRCKSIVKNLYWPYPTKINYRSHYDLLVLLANRYNKTVDELVKTNPLKILGVNNFTKHVIGGYSYRQLETRLQYEQAYVN